MARKGPFKDLAWGRLNKGKTSKTKVKRSNASHQRTGLMSQLKQVAGDAATPKNKPSGPMKAIVLHVYKIDPAAAAGSSWMTSWYDEVLGVPKPETVKMKVRIPTLHAGIPEPDQYGCGSSPGKHWLWINMHPTFYASSQDIEMPECGDVVIVSVDNPSEAGHGGGGVVLSTVVTRENNPIKKGGSCPPSQAFPDATSTTAAGADGDALGGESASALAVNPFGLPADCDFDCMVNFMSSIAALPPPAPGRNPDGSINPIASPYEKKGIFINRNSLSDENMPTPLIALTRALWADLKYVVLECCEQTASKTHKTDRDLLILYARMFALGGIQVYVSGTPHPGKSSKFVEYMTETATAVGAKGMIMSPSWGYLSPGNKDKYSRHASYLTNAMMRAAMQAELQLGFTNSWLPSAEYTVAEVDGSDGAVSIRYKDSFPYSCFTNVDWTICQVLSRNGRSEIKVDESTGEVALFSSHGSNAMTEDDFVLALSDYTDMGFKNLVPAFGAMGQGYEDYEVSSEKPPVRMNEELDFLAAIQEPSSLGELAEDSDDPSFLSKPGMAQTGFAVPDWGSGYFGRQILCDDEDPDIRCDGGVDPIWGAVVKSRIVHSVMWWDWLNAEKHTPCWQSTRWEAIKHFHRYSPVAMERAQEGGGSADGNFDVYTKKIQETIEAIEAYNKIAEQDPSMQKTSLEAFMLSVETAPSATTFDSADDMESYGQAASAVAQSSATELGYDGEGSASGTGSDIDDLVDDYADSDAYFGSDPTEESAIERIVREAQEEVARQEAAAASTTTGAALSDVLDRYPAFSYIKFDAPVGGGSKGGYYPAYAGSMISGDRSYRVGSRSPVSINFVVIHTTAGSSQLAGGEVFCRPGAKVSTHYGVNTGGWVYQFVKEKDVAFGNGGSGKHGNPPQSQGNVRSIAGGRDKEPRGANANGISIEITGIPKEEANEPGKWYTEVMYSNLALLVANICKRNRISVDRKNIFGHDEMTMRKSDPGTKLDNPYPEGVSYPYAGNPRGGVVYPGAGFQINSYSPNKNNKETFDWAKFMRLVEGFFSGAGVPLPPNSTFPAGTAGAASAGAGGTPPPEQCAAGAGGAPGSPLSSAQIAQLGDFQGDWPSGGSPAMTSDFGPRTPPSGGSMAAGSQGSSAHGGIDVISLNPVSSGNPGVIPIFAISDGVVESCCGSTGAWLSIDHGDGLTSQYGHMANYAVRTGDRVTRGQVVGTMGTTGNSTGVHLHFQIKQNGRTVDPMSNLGLQCSAAAKAHTSQGIHCRDGNQNMDGNGSF